MGLQHALCLVHVGVGAGLRACMLPLMHDCRPWASHGLLLSFVVEPGGNVPSGVLQGEDGAGLGTGWEAWAEKVPSG